MRHILRLLRIAVAGLLLAAVAWSPRATAAAAVALGSAAAGPGEAAGISVSFTGDGTAVGLQFDVAFDASRLSAGFAYATALTSGHRVNSSSPAPGVARVLIYSLSNKPLPNGDLATLPLKVLSPAVVGTVGLNVSNLIVSSASATQITPATSSPGSVQIRDSSGSRLQLPSIAANRQATLRLNGVEGRTYTLQGSVDLRLWETVATAVASGGVATFTDAATRPFRFYRAVEAP